MADEQLESACECSYQSLKPNFTPAQIDIARIVLFIEETEGGLLLHENHKIEDMQSYAAVSADIMDVVAGCGLQGMFPDAGDGS